MLPFFSCPYLHSVADNPSHVAVLQKLVNVWREAGQADQVPELIADYLRRDLINKILGNADNHGRNTAIIRTRDAVRLAPIYDLAPMVMDQEGITQMQQTHFAQMCKVSVRTLIQIEQGEGNPTLKSLNAVFKPFGLQMGVVRRNRQVR